MTQPASPRPDEPLPVVLAGAHGYGRLHRDNLRRLTAAGQVRVVGVCDPKPLADEDLAALDGPPQSPDLARLLEQTGPAITVVSTPIHTHVGLALTAVRAGSHVLLEKPPAPSLSGFRQLTTAFKEHGRVCQVGFQSAGSAALEAVRRLVTDGAIGRVRGIGAAGAWVRDGRYYARAPWAGRRRLDAVEVVDGVLTNPLAHAVATALRLDGSDREEDVAAVEPELYRAHDIEADDTACVRIGTARGTTITVAASLCAERNSPPYVVVHGERGRITLRYTDDHVLLERDGHPPEESTHSRTDLLENLVAHLGQCTSLLSPLERSGAFMRVVEEIRTAPEPTALPPEFWRTDTSGAAPRRVIPGIGALVEASAARLSLFSELDALWAARGRPRTVHIAGDSTAAAKPASAAPMAGWGMALPLFLGRGLTVANHARDGRSSLSFLAEGRLDALVGALRPGDLALIQFGHNDQKADDPTRYTDPDTTYRDNLLHLIAAVRAVRAVPVLLTPVERRCFGPDGSARHTHGGYAEAARSAAAEADVALIDIQATSHALWQQLGPEASKDAFLWLAPGEHPNHPRGARDDTHVRSRGAIAVARLVARGLRAAGILGAGDVRRLEDEDVLEAGLMWHQEAPR